MTTLPKVTKERHVYVIGVRNGPQKVGLAYDPLKRLEGLQTGTAEVLELWWSTPTPQAMASKVEAEAHRILRDSHVRGEWFTCSPEEARRAVEEAINAIREGRTPKRCDEIPSRPMTAQQFREALADLRLSQIGFVRLVEQLGGEKLSLRAVQFWVAGDRPVPPLVPAILSMLKQLGYSGKQTPKPPLRQANLAA